MKRYYTYEVIEDNGGGLTLALTWRGKIRYAFPDWEMHAEELLSNLNDLDAGTARPEEWENALPEPGEAVAKIKSYQYGWELICRGWRGLRDIWPDDMGAAGKLAFGIE